MSNTSKSVKRANEITRIVGVMFLCSSLLFVHAQVTAQSIPFHADYPAQYLSKTGGTLEGHLGDPFPYYVSMTYPAGAPPVLADITRVPFNKNPPATLSKLHVNAQFGLGPGQPGLVFKGTTTFNFSIPTSIMDGSTLKLVFWLNDQNGNVSYGNTLSAVSSNHTVSFSVVNLTMPRYNGLGMTLGE